MLMNDIINNLSRLHYSGQYYVCEVTLSVYPHRGPGKLEKYAWPRWESNLRLRPLEYGQVGSSM